MYHEALYYAVFSNLLLLLPPVPKYHLQRPSLEVTHPPTRSETKTTRHAVNLCIYTVRKVICDRPQSSPLLSLNTAVYEAATVQSIGKTVQGLRAFCLHLL